MLKKTAQLMNARQVVFPGTESSGWLLFCAVVVVAAAVSIVLLLRYERTLVPRRVGRWLFVLRLSVVAVLFLTLLEPTLVWTTERANRGRILIAIDLSASMNTMDVDAGRDEKLRWARGMGMIGNSEVNARLDRWIDALEQGEEPEWIDEDEMPTLDPAARELLQNSRKENLERICSEVVRFPRKEIAMRLLTGMPRPLIDRLQRAANVDLALFAGNIVPVDESTLSGLVVDPPESLNTDRSSLVTAMSYAATADASSPLLAVVLLTDGCDNGGGDPIIAAEQLAQTSIPVYPVLLGSDRQPKDLRIAALDYPQSPFKDDVALLKATLGTSGFEGAEITVVLEREGDEENRLSRTITPTGASTQVEFPMKTESLGRHRYTLRTGVRPGETRDDNNEKLFVVNVVDDKVRVLLVEGEARWEFRFIDNALKRDERVDIAQVVFQQPYLGVLPESFFPRRLELPQGDDDLGSSPFFDPDLVILGDVSPDDMPQLGWELLERFVSEAGGTLVLLAGKQHFPLAHNSSIVDRLLPLSAIRPISITDRSATAPPSMRGFRLQLTPDGEAKTFLHFDDDSEQNRNIWQQLPGHSWGLVGEVKPGATVFAQAGGTHEFQGYDDSQPPPLIVHQRYGFGQVLWIGIDSTWRWRHRTGDKYHHRFWGQLGRWAAEIKATAGNELVNFGPETSEIEVGQDAVIRARWPGSTLQEFPNLRSKAEVFQTGPSASSIPFTTIELKPRESRKVVHEGRAVSLPVGEYVIKLAVEGADVETGDISAALSVSNPSTPELDDVTANHSLLAEIANASAGRLLLPDQLERLSELFRDPQVVSSQETETKLWSHWLVFMLFLLLMTSEWIIRRMNGLP